MHLNLSKQTLLHLLPHSLVRNRCLSAYRKLLCGIRLPSGSFASQRHRSHAENERQGGSAPNSIHQGASPDQQLHVFAFWNCDCGYLGPGACNCHWLVLGRRACDAGVARSLFRDVPKQPPWCWSVAILGSSAVALRHELVAIPDKDVRCSASCGCLIILQQQLQALDGPPWLSFANSCWSRCCAMLPVRRWVLRTRCRRSFSVSVSFAGCTWISRITSWLPRITVFGCGSCVRSVFQSIPPCGFARPITSRLWRRARLPLLAPAPLSTMPTLLLHR